MSLELLAELILLFAFAASLWPRRDARPTRSYLSPVVGTLAAIMLGSVGHHMGRPWRAILPDVALLALFFQPYFLLRLVSALNPVSRRVLWTVGLGTLALVVLAALSPHLSARVRPVATAVELLFLVGAQAYGTGRLWAAGRGGLGAARQRARMLAAASALLTLVLLAVIGAAAARLALSATVLGLALALIAVLYLLAVATPRWLSHAWQMPVLYRYYGADVNLHRDGETAIQDALLELALQVVTGISGEVLGKSPDGPGYHRITARGPSGAVPNVGHTAEDPEGLLERAWAEGAIAVARMTPTPGVAQTVRRVIVVPVRAGGETLRLLRLYTALEGLFLQDDTVLLAALAAHAGALLLNARAFAQEVEVAGALRDANRALEAASAAKSDFLSGMSHEFRTPLNAIIGFSDLLLVQNDSLNDRQRRYVGNILESGQHLLQIVNDVLDIAKADAARLDIRPMAVRLGRVMEGALVLVRPQAEAGGVELVDATNPAAVLWADELRVRQVLVNLLSNAVKFTPRGGQVRVGSARRDGFWEVSVADTGIGIEPDQLARVFDEFTQVSHGVDRAYEGTGLGLPLVRRLTEAMGGGVRAQSVPGEGSVFTVWFPAAPTETERWAPPPGGPAGSTAVLVVDDDPMVREFAVHVLSDAGYAVYAAPSLDTAREALRTRLPAVIILDILLNGEYGDSLLAAAAALTPPPKVLVMSIVDPGRRPLSGAVSEWLVKPVRADRLRAAVADLLTARASEEVVGDG